MSHRTLRFRSNRFGQPDPNQNPPSRTPYGRDFAEWIRQQLQAGGWRLTEPVAQGRVWRMECHQGAQRHDLAVGLDGEGWRVTLNQPRSLLASILGRDSRVDGGLEDALQMAVIREPAISGVRWFDSDAAGSNLLAIARG